MRAERNFLAWIYSLFEPFNNFCKRSIDADCSSQPDCLQTLAGISQQTNRPVQAAYLMESPKNPSTKDLISALAFLVKNVVRSTGLMKLGLPSLLNGSGMAFPWEAIKSVSLASGNIV